MQARWLDLLSRKARLTRRMRRLLCTVYKCTLWLYRWAAPLLVPPPPRLLLLLAIRKACSLLLQQWATDNIKVGQNNDSYRLLLPPPAPFPHICTYCTINWAMISLVYITVSWGKKEINGRYNLFVNQRTMHCHCGTTLASSDIKNVL